MSQPERQLLPTTVRPTHYHLSLAPDLERATFAAEVTIDVSIAEPVAAITLHAVGLKFSVVTVRCDTAAASAADGAETRVTVLSVDECAEDQSITLRLDRTVANAAQLFFVYTAAMSENLLGFYRSYYVHDGVRHYVGSTQLCPAEARCVFPCWDEPAVKATFFQDITVPSTLQVWSNDKPQEVVELPGGLVRWSFRPPFVMSTYLVAWVIGEMESAEVILPGSESSGGVGGKSVVTPHPVVIRATTARGKVQDAAFALSVAAKVLPLYASYFRCSYVFSKLDLIALPNFAFGAMENWGCITFREQALLASENASATQKERVALVVAHELAHQWFGNLATMAWWSDLWLNESFATYMATWAVSKLFPEWRVDTQFVYTEGSRALQLDALRSSHAVELPVRDVREVDGIFDAISYAKGAMVLRMTAKFMGEDAFQRGLVDYIALYAYSSATSQELWQCLSGPAAPNLKELLQMWTLTQGYPYLNATMVFATGALTLTQHRFLVVNDAAPEEDSALWQIPIHYAYGTADGTVKVASLVLSERTTTVNLTGALWVKINSDQIAFCRVRYDRPLLQALATPLSTQSINGTDRYSLLADYAAFARGGYCNTVEAMALLAHYRSEEDYTVWCEAAQFEKKLRCLLGTSTAEVQKAFDAYCIQLYKPHILRLGFEQQAGEDHRTQQTRLLLFSRLLACGDAEATAFAQKLYTDRHTSPIPTGMLGGTFAVHIRTNGPSALKELQDLIAQTTYAEARTQYLSALAAVPEPSTGVLEVMEYLLSDAVNGQDMAMVMVGLAERPQTQTMLVHQIMHKWPRLAHKAPPMVLGGMLKMVEHCYDAVLEAPLQMFFTALPAEMQSRTSMTFQQGLEGLRCNAAWAARDGASVANYLLEQYEALPAEQR